MSRVVDDRDFLEFLRIGCQFEDVDALELDQLPIPQRPVVLEMQSDR
jgi:hypothetical protein